MNGDRTLAGLGLRLVAVMLLISMAALIKLAQARGAKLAELMLFRQLFAIPVMLAYVAVGPGLATPSHATPGWPCDTRHARSCRHGLHVRCAADRW